MLVGSNSETMARTGLTALSTYGILARSGFSRKEVTDILDALEEAGFVAPREVGSMSPRPVLDLTDFGALAPRQGCDDSRPGPAGIPGREAALGGLERSLTPPQPSIEPDGEPVEDRPEAAADAPPPRAEIPAEITSDPLWETLRGLRTTWAREAGMPAYCVFWNQTLEALVRERPRTPSELARIKGMSPAKMERYGKALLEAITASPAAPEAPAAPAPSSGPSSHVPTEEWTWRLLDRGFTLDEAADIRGLERSAILRHALWAAPGPPRAPVRIPLPRHDRPLDRLAHAERRTSPAR